MNMRRLTSILIGIGAALAVAQAAVAEFATIPITVTRQTLEVYGFGMTTGEVAGGSSVGTPWNFGNEDGSTNGTVSSVLTDGELVLTISGALSKGGTAAQGVYLAIQLGFLLQLTAPDFGESTTPAFFQWTKTSSAIGGTISNLEFVAYLEPEGSDYYFSQLLDGLVSLGYVFGYLPQAGTSFAMPVDFIPGDTVSFNWATYYEVYLAVDSSTGTFSETYTFRAITPTPVPEPTSSLTIPSGAAMLIALAKLRGTGLGR
jgi:hypothetical protein